jgi:hypothetical protein
MVTSVMNPARSQVGSGEGVLVGKGVLVAAGGLVGSEEVGSEDGAWVVAGKAGVSATPWARAAIVSAAAVSTGLLI